MKRNLNAAAVGIVLFGLLTGLALLRVVWSSPNHSATFLAVLPVFVSWPFVVGALSLLFGWTFRSELSTFIQNIGSIRLPGGGEIKTRQRPGESESPKLPEVEAGGMRLTKEQVTIVQHYIADLQQQATTASSQAATASDEKDQILKAAAEMLSERDRMVWHWFFSYLNLFLIFASKMVLRWFSAFNVGITKEFYETTWNKLITDADQREVIFNVLLNHGLIEPHEGLFRITNSGRGFLAFVGQQDTT